MAKGKYVQWLQPDNLLRLQACTRDGATDAEIAAHIGISRDTLYSWKRKYPDFSDALKRGKEVIDIEVENALLKRAMGYEYNEITKEMTYAPNGEPLGLAVTKVVTKRERPDVTAQIFWLKNRRPDLWRDVKNVDMQAKIENNPFDGVKSEDIKKLIADD